MAEEPAEYRPRRALIEPDLDERQDARRSVTGPGLRQRIGEAVRPAGGKRVRLALLAGAVAAIVVLGLVIGYAVLGLNGGTANAGPSGTTGSPSAGTATTGTETPDPSILLSDASMLTVDDVHAIDKSRTWSVAATVKGHSPDAPQVACLSQTVPGQPQPLQTILRTLTASGKKAPAVLHEADSFTSAEEASEAFNLMSTSLGGCDLPSAYITSGNTLSGLGDQAVGVVLKVSGEDVHYRSLLIVRTGKVIDVLDVAQVDAPVSMKDLASTMASAVKGQCEGAGGSCEADPKVSEGPPPPGGDQPGFLAAADLPPVGKAGSMWTGDSPGQPDDVVGSGCEGVDFGTAKEPTAKTARTYFIDDQAAPSEFGIDEVILTMKDSKAAGSMVKKITDNLKSCEDSSPTAEVSKPKTVKGTGHEDTAIKGSVFTVTQQVNANRTATYRVGILSAGDKVVYTFLPTDKKFDLTDNQWTAVNVRAGERVTQAD